MAIGQIKELSIVDGQITAVVETGSGPAVTATVMPQAGGEFHPQVGDTVYFRHAGQEVVVLGIFSSDAITTPGESLIFARNAAGEVVTKIHLKADGIAYVGTGLDFVALAAKVDASIDAIVNAIAGAAVLAGDGGAAFKANIGAALGISLPAIGSVASTNLKAD